MQVWKYSEDRLYSKVFFKDYWILTVTKKKKTREKPIDIGYLISCEVITKEKNSMHTIGNIKIISYFETKHQLYEQIESFLKLLYYIKKNIPEGAPHYEIFDILYTYIPISHENNKQKYILSYLKIISLLWELWESHQNPTSAKILKFIANSKYTDVLRLWKIPEENLQHLEQML